MPHDRSLIEGEESVLILHPHWKTIIGPIAVLAIVIIVAAVVIAAVPFGSAGTAGRSVVAGVALLVAALWSGIPVLRWRTTTYELTTRRLRMRAGILSRSGKGISPHRGHHGSFP